MCGLVIIGIKVLKKLWYLNNYCRYLIQNNEELNRIEEG